MYKFEINKTKLNNNFTGIHTPSLGLAVGELKLCGLKLYLYLAGHKDGTSWNLNPSVFAEWLGVEPGRTVRKTITDGIADLEANGYLELIGEETYKFSEQKIPKNAEEQIQEQIVPKIVSEIKTEQIVPKKEEFIF